MGSCLCPLYRVGLIFTLLTLLSFPHLAANRPLNFWAKLCRCFSQQIHLPNQFLPTLLVVSSSHLPVTHAKMSVSGATCYITCWCGSTNCSVLKGYMEKEKKTLHIAICFNTPWLLCGNNMGVATGEERVLGALKNRRLNLPSAGQGYCSGHLPMWCVVSGIAFPCLHLGLPGSFVTSLHGPGSKLTSSVKHRLYWTSFKPPSPALCPSHRQHGQNGIPLSPALFFAQRTAPQGLQINCVQHIFPVILCAFLGCQPHGLNRVCACWCLHQYYLADPASCFATSSMEKRLAFYRDESNTII